MYLFVAMMVIDAMAFTLLCAIYLRKFTLIKAFLFVNLMNILIFIILSVTWIIIESDGYMQLAGIGIFAVQILLLLLASTIYFGVISRTKA